MNKSIKDPGLGTISNERAKRFIDPKGNFNVKHLNKKKSIQEAYAYIISLSWYYVIGIIIAAFACINVIFALIYTLLGAEALGISSDDISSVFFNSFFFSVQTLTTLGYGYLSPLSLTAGIVSSIEAFLGLIFFAFITGVLFGKFSKPQANIRFSDHMVLCKHNGQRALMFKVMSLRKNMLVLSKVKTSLLLSTQNEDDSFTNRFFDLKLERDQITYFATTWTVVHILDSESPLKDFTDEEISKLHGEFLILLSYYDESFNQDIHRAHSYTFEDILVNKRFLRAFEYNEKGQMELDHNKLNVFKKEL